VTGSKFTPVVGPILQSEILNWQDRACRFELADSSLLIRACTFELGTFSLCKIGLATGVGGDVEEQETMNLSASTLQTVHLEVIKII